MAKTAKGQKSTGGSGGWKKQAAKKWVLKPIPEKKAQKPQKKMNQYFPITKAKAPPLEINFQGFPLSECVFAAEIGTYVYCPPAYGNNAMRKGGRVCPDCYLSPCFAKEKDEEIHEFLCDFPIHNVFNSDNEMDEAYEKMVDRIERMLTESFGAKYASSVGVPDCCERVVSEYAEFARETRDHPDARCSPWSADTMHLLWDPQIFMYNDESLMGTL